MTSARNVEFERVDAPPDQKLLRTVEFVNVSVTPRIGGSISWTDRSVGIDSSEPPKVIVKVALAMTSDRIVELEIGFRDVASV